MKLPNKGDSQNRKPSRQFGTSHAVAPCSRMTLEAARGHRAAMFRCTGSSIVCTSDVSSEASRVI